MSLGSLQTDPGTPTARAVSPNACRKAEELVALFAEVLARRARPGDRRLLRVARPVPELMGLRTKLGRSLPLR